MFDYSKIDELLREQGRTSRWLATRTGYHFTSISKFLNGHEPIPDEFAEKTALALGVPLHWLAQDEPSVVLEQEKVSA